MNDSNVTVTPAGNQQTTICLAENKDGYFTCQVKFHKAESSFLLLVGILFNSIAIAVLIRVRRRTRARTSSLTILLAANDLFGCTIILTSTVINTITCDRLQSSPFCNALGLLAMCSYTGSLNVVVLLSVERYILVKYPFFHLKRQSKIILISICLTGLLIDSTLAGLPLLGVGLPYQYYDDNRFCAFSFRIKCGGTSHKALVAGIAVNGMLRAFTVAYCNIVVSFLMKIRSSKNVGTWNETQAKTMETALTFSRLTQIIALTNVILTVPFCVRLLVDVGQGSKDNLNGIGDTITSILLYVTPLVNPVLYVASNETYRRCLWEMITCKNVNIITYLSSRRKSDSLFSSHRPSEPTANLTISKTTQGSSPTLDRAPNTKYYKDSVC